LILKYANYESVELVRRKFGMDGFLRTTMSGDLPTHSEAVTEYKKKRELKMQKRDEIISKRIALSGPWTGKDSSKPHPPQQ